MPSSSGARRKPKSKYASPPLHPQHIRSSPPGFRLRSSLHGDRVISTYAQPELLPLDVDVWGSQTQRKLLRTLSLYFSVAAAGIALIEGASNVHLRIFGLGMLWPGAGFLAHAGLSSLAGWAHIGLCMAMTILFCAALLLWFATGNIIA